MDNGIVRYDPGTEKFAELDVGQQHVRPRSERQCLAHRRRRHGHPVQDRHHDRATKLTMYPIPKNAGDLRHRHQFARAGRIIYIWREGKVGIFDPKTENYNDYQTPTPISGPRRGQIDAQDRLWVAQYYAGQVAMFDPDSRRSRNIRSLPAASRSVRPMPSPMARRSTTRTRWSGRTISTATASIGSTSRRASRRNTSCRRTTRCAI